MNEQISWWKGWQWMKELKFTPFYDIKLKDDKVQQTFC